MKEITLTQGYKARVDAENYEQVRYIRWHPCKRKTALIHAIGTVNGKSIFMHRLIMGIADPHILVDHINGNGLDNRKKNLRIANNLTNAYHRPRRRDSTLKYKGLARAGNKYSASIKHNGKREYLGQFDTQEEAAYAYNKAALKYHGEYAFLNDIPEFEQYSGA